MLVKNAFALLPERTEARILNIADYGTALKKGSPCNSSSRGPTLGHRDLGLRWLLTAIHITGNNDADCLHPTRHIAYTIKSTIRERVLVSIVSLVG